MSGVLQGLRPWLYQRLTAVYLIIFFVYALLHLLFYPPHSYSEWHQWVSQPFVALNSFVFFICMLIHAWIGIRDVILDYVPGLGLRMVFLAVFLFILTACAVQILFTFFSLAPAIFQG